MKKIIVTTPDELSEILTKIVNDLDISHFAVKAEKTDDNYMNINEAAKYLNLAKQTIYGFTSRGQIPHIKKAKRLLFRKSDLDQWLTEGSYTPSNPTANNL